MTAQAESIEGLRTAVRGSVITPADAGYDDARRVWNAIIDRRPAAMVRCRSAADAITAVNFARDNRLPLAVRGGAHNVAGRCTCDDGIVIDFSEMKSIRVDPAAETVRAEPGLRWAEFDRETQAFGLATTGGTVGDTGIAGLRRRRRPGERHARSRLRAREPGPVLGAARWRRQFRGGHLVRVQAPSNRADDRRRHCRSSVSAGSRSAAVLR